MNYIVNNVFLALTEHYFSQTDSLKIMSNELIVLEIISTHSKLGKRTKKRKINYYKKKKNHNLKLDYYNIVIIGIFFPQRNFQSLYFITDLKTLMLYISHHLPIQITFSSISYFTLNPFYYLV